MFLQQELGFSGIPSFSLHATCLSFMAALNTAGVANDFTYVSTAGGAFLEWMEGKTLPGVAALQQQNG